MEDKIMTQEEKDLLLKDLCARLPYGTLIYAQNDIDWYESEICTQVLSDVINDDYVIKPYLFPLSSMTEEQYEKFIIISGWDVDIEDVKRGKFSCIGYVGLDVMYDAIDWFNKNHLDYRGLIEKGLAIDATNLGIY